MTGSLAYDHIMSMPGKFKDHIMPDKVHMLNVSFIMQEFRKEFGGTGGNIAYSLSLLGVPTFLMGSGGHDFAPYRERLNAFSGVDASGVREFSDLATAQGFVMTDKEDNQIWGFYDGAMRRESELSLVGVVREGDYLVISPNNPAAMVQYVKEAVSSKVPYMFDPAFNIPHFSHEDMVMSVENAEVLIGNDYEIELIRRNLRWTEDEFFADKRVVVTTMGSEGSLVRKGPREIKIPVAKIKSVVDPTGAGDGYRAGFVAAYIRGKELEVCSRIGSVSAGYCVENYGTQNQSYTLDEFKARYKESYGEELSL